MRILHKLLLGMVLPAGSIAWIGLHSANAIEQELLVSIEQSSFDKTSAIAGEMGRMLGGRLAECRWFAGGNDLQAALGESNREYSQRTGVEAYIDREDARWRAARDEPNELMRSLESSPLAMALKRRLLTLEVRPGVYAFGEVFVTNKFGANVAQTNPTSDFRQNDEDWWQAAWNHGSYIGDVEFDESAGIHSVALCTRIDGPRGESLGVMKAVLSLQEVVRVLNQHAPDDGDRRERDLMLFSRDGRLIHHAGEALSTAHAEATHLLPVNPGTKNYQREDPELGLRLASIAEVPTQDGFGSVGWKVVLESDYSSTVAPARAARAKIMWGSLLAALVAAGFGALIAFSCSRRLEALTNASAALGRGSYSARVAEHGRDELGALGASFNQMAQRLGEYATQLESRAQDSEAASKAKGEFLASVSHELRTPMNGIIGMSSFLLDTELSEEQESYVKTVTGCAETLLSLVNDVLDLSKLESGDLVYEKVQVNLAQHARQALDVVRPAVQRAGLCLDLSVGPGVPEVIASDGSRLRQVLLNLLSNAVKFTSDGSVRLSIELASGQAGFLLFEVKDTGIGIAEEHLDDVFGRYAQAEASITRRYGGTGLGLAISKRIVEGLGGELGVRSRLGEGSSFWFRWPFSVEDLSTPIGAQSELARESELPRDLRVLVAEDNPVNRMVIQKQLSKLGFGATLVNDGIEVLKAAAEAEWDVILMDCHMPGMDGFEATAAIRALGGRAAKLPIVALTANAMVGDKERCLQAGMNDYVTKPASIGDIRRVLTRLHYAHREALELAAGRPGEGRPPAQA